jgi:hypothetical protein
MGLLLLDSRDYSAISAKVPTSLPSKYHIYLSLDRHTGNKWGKNGNSHKGKIFSSIRGQGKESFGTDESRLKKEV